MNAEDEKGNGADVDVNVEQGGSKGGEPDEGGQEDGGDDGEQGGDGGE